MRMLDLDPIRERLERRTQGEWIIAHGDDETQDEIYVIDDLGEIDEYPSTTTIAEGLLAVDSRFIANAPTDIASLIEEVKRLREALGWYAGNQYGNVQFDPPIPDIPILHDRGEHARHALEGIH